MEREEIISGLRNAVERGYSLDLSVQSFINAGYSRQDVLDSAKILGYGRDTISGNPQQTSQPQATQENLNQSQQIQQSSQSEKYSNTAQQNIPNLQQSPQQPKPSYQPLVPQQQIQAPEKSWFRENWLIILLGVILLLLIIGLLASIFAKDFVLGILNSMGLNLT